MQQVKNLKDKTVAILATDGFEEIELTAPQEELAGYGATIHIVSDKPKIKSWKNKQWGNEFESDRLKNRQM
jgi:protease I